ncbi:MAG: hypothetical protein FWF53_12495 [Candidatus Azobacteroides sp.]|nr:hypothetical protein [Candidatus Azobacteroides sp.]
MRGKQNDLLSAKILESIPDNIKPIEFLTELLNIGKESAYRRMRSEIPFTFEEITKLALELDFSVDEIIGKNKEERIFLDLQVNSSSSHEESFLAMLQEYYKYTDLISAAQSKEVYVVLNRLSLATIISYDTLFKLYFYNWKNQTYNISINDSFSETHIPHEINAIRQQFKLIKPNLYNVHYIIDRDIFQNIVREIQYYYNRKLISDDEIVALREELSNVLKNIETIMQTGCNDTGASANYYLSLLDIETNTNVATFDGNIASLYWMHPVNSICIVNQEICNMQKRWIESIKKYSVLVTLSNEILQAEFINKQIEYLSNLTKEIIYF